MKIQIYEPYINIVDLKTIHEATISVSATGSITATQLREHIRELEKSLLELEWTDKTVTREIKEQRVL